MTVSMFRMWLLILLHVLGLNVCQVNGQENSTQNSTKMYYFKLEIDESAIENITQLLRPFVSSTDFHVEDVQKTTICQNVSAGTQCTCEPHFRWSDEVCEKVQKCCDNNKCNFTEENSSHMCVSNTSVIINGSITTTLVTYLDCLKDQDDEDYKTCNENITTEMKRVWSTLRGFDILKILSYSLGSVIVEFEVTVAGEVKQQDLTDRSKKLAEKLEGSIILETTGFVQLTMPPNPVEYESRHNVKCTVQEDLKTPLWQLRQDGQKFNITNGTESDVTINTFETEITLKNITELWAGEYVCLYYQAAKRYTISHIARAELDVCLVPKITTYREPQFILCTNTTAVHKVTVTCEMSSSNEKYTVSWGSTHDGIVTLQPSAKASVSGGISVYEAVAIVKCEGTPWVTCSFTNRCNQNSSANITIENIPDDKYCKAEAEWGNTKSGFTALLRCKNLAGTRKRDCREDQWQEPIDGCVDLKLSNTLESAKIVDIGRGELNDNTAKVFSQLQNVTNNTAGINSAANVRTSIEVLFTLSNKSLHLQQEKVVDDFLESTSNVLERSLTNSWKPTAGDTDQTPAEKYLHSVEALIDKTDLPNSTKRNVDVNFRNCSKDPCVNSAFNVTVELSGTDPGIVKTAGFKELQTYLPNNDTDLEPNSIVVSTIADNTDSVKIKINFQLQKQRPHNVEIKCVAWDSSARRWSTSGCEWGGPSNEGLCTCNHLSSFAILMSRHPIEIPLIDEITEAGLSVSIISLTISLVIELMVWNAVVKTNTLYLRHTAHVNIIICLLVADVCFLASSDPKSISEIWCQTFVVLKHFCYLAMFFWMLCLSITLLHQAVFLFHSVSKKTYLRISLLLGYVCPLLIVAITFLTNKSGASDSYFSRETCWLVYSGTFKGSIHTFIIPVGIIVFINVFSMVVVIMKLLDHPKNTQKSNETEKKAAITVVRSVVLLTPIFGVTWLFGFAVLLVDLTSGNVAYAVNYAFTLLNAFQGLFILCTTCLGDKLTRDALLNRLKAKASASTSNDTSTRTDATWKK